MVADVHIESFGKLLDGRPVTMFTLRNAKGMQVQLLNYGAILHSIKVPVDGVLREVTLSYDNIEGYQDNPIYFGVTVGRIANRIDKGTFKLEGKVYKTICNNPPNSLHGGSEGFGKKLWNWQVVDSEVIFTLLSPDGDQGYPGNVHAKATYSLNDDNELSCIYEAETDRTTIINMTNHVYLNLDDWKTKTVLDHTLQIHCDEMPDVDGTLMLTGKISPVSFAFDFREPKKIGRDYEIAKNTSGWGYDHNFNLSKRDPGIIVWSGDNKVKLEIFTSSPGVQFYTGNYLDEKVICREGIPCFRCAGMALEPQNYPDAINHDNFPSSVLKPGEHYKNSMSWKFTV